MKIYWNFKKKKGAERTHCENLWERSQFHSPHGIRNLQEHFRASKCAERTLKGKVTPRLRPSMAPFN